MPIRAILREGEKFELQMYEQPKNYAELRKTHVAFSGSPQKHPYDSERVVLITDPFSSNFSFYEFKAKDISYAEELPNVVNLDGGTVPMARIWVRKKSLGVRCTPFVVEEIRP